MLRWQLQDWLKRLSLGTKVILFSCMGHLIVLFCLLVLYRGDSPYSVVVTSTMINTDVPIVFMPLYKSIKPQPIKGSSGAKGGSAKANAPAAQPETQMPVATALEDKKEKITTTVAAISTKPQSVKKSKKKLSKKEQLAQAKKAKADAAKKACPQPKKIEPAKKEIKPVVQLAPPTDTPPIAAPLPVAEVAPTQQAHGVPGEAIGQDVLYVGQQEMEALQTQDYIQQEMAQHWSPPAGMRDDLETIVQVMINYDGTLGAITIEKSSGVMIFDGAATRAVAQLQPPQWAKGKTLSITFKP